MSQSITVIPRCTYRIQLHADFDFDEASKIVDYLEELGVSHIYCSPYLQASKGSKHGYDVLNHSQVNVELGGAAGHARFCEKLAQHNLGQIVDIVPNHMSIEGRLNSWWWDVLENGPSSRYADYFDVDWQPIEQKLHNTVLLPVLGDHYGRVLEAGEIQLTRSLGAFTIKYYDHEFPVAPRSLDELLAQAAETSESDLLRFIARSFGQLPLATLVDRKSTVRRHHDKEVLRTLLDRVCEEDAKAIAAIDHEVERINSCPDLLEALLERQNYRLAFWRTAGQELDYRRFFDINTLISLRVEDDQVFEDTHHLVLQWLKAGQIDGLRVDHPDGLLDPKQYFARLQQAAPGTWVVAEKILEQDELLPQQWDVSGTTGYDFLNLVNQLFINPLGEKSLSDFNQQFSQNTNSYEEIVYEKKQLVIRELFGSDIQRLTSLLSQVCEQHRRYRDYTRRELGQMLREVIACFPVYRTYIRAAELEVTSQDREIIHQVIEKAKSLRPEIDHQLFDFFRDILLLRLTGDLESELVMRFQQTTGPVMAKGVEDTAFYHYFRLAGLNEVGGNPGAFGASLEDFHGRCKTALERHKHSLLASTTHDTKRSEDVRARLAVLSEIPAQWATVVQDWSNLNASYLQGEWPDRNTEYLIYQTMVGAWPISCERLQAYLEKAVREAKQFTSWTSPNHEYEAAVQEFLTGIYQNSEFISQLEDFVSQIILPGQRNSLAQTLIRLTAPGVPDIYQGTEVWTFTLVDPDNRQPVDFQLRRKMLQKLDELSIEEIVRRADEGYPKLWVIRQALRLRKLKPHYFENGSYTPLQVSGSGQKQVIAFLRADKVATIVSRWSLDRSGISEESAISLPKGTWKNWMTGEEFSVQAEVPVNKLLRKFSVALLEKIG